MRALCRGNGIPFFVFLQPNQYLPGRKPMGREEQAVAILDGKLAHRSKSQISSLIFNEKSVI
jgi:hypothetical protein